MASFKSFLPERVLEQADEPVGQRLLAEYGSVFVARGGAIPPDRIIFRDQDDVTAFQNNVEIGSVRFDDLTIELQKAAADNLTHAVELARSKVLTITPRGADSGRRSYDETVELWLSRVEPALDHWTANGRLSEEDAENIRSLSPFEQVPTVLSLEEQGIYFAKDLSKTILYSVAPPGTSQHLSMLAFDVAEFNEPRVREILEADFWYQTVPSDLPHFTFLGVPVDELPGLGLTTVTSNERVFWVPDLRHSID
jgi:hypothetical protein